MARLTDGSARMNNNDALEDDEVTVSIRRSGGRSRVEVVLPAGVSIDHGAVATRVHARYCEGRHPGADTVVDIAVRTATVVA